MADKSSLSNSTKSSAGVTIGDVRDGIRDSLIAGRDIIIGDHDVRTRRKRRKMLKLLITSQNYKHLC